MLATFELLSANAASFQNNNVTLLNVAASDKNSSVDVLIPQFDRRAVQILEECAKSHRVAAGVGILQGRSGITARRGEREWAPVSGRDGHAKASQTTDDGEAAALIGIEDDCFYAQHLDSQITA
jgi:hypothetical protein